MGKPKTCNPCCDGGADSSSSRSPSLVYNPGGCPATLDTCVVYPAQWAVAFSGWSDGTCSECTNMNNTFIVTYAPIIYAPNGNHCQWDYCTAYSTDVCRDNAEDFFVCDFISGMRLSLVNSGGVAVFRLTIAEPFPKPSWVWQTSGAINCIGANTLNLNGTTTQDPECTVPATILIEPA